MNQQEGILENEIFDAPLETIQASVGASFSNMSAPNPKRSVALNFLNLLHEEDMQTSQTRNDQDHLNFNNTLIPGSNLNNLGTSKVGVSLLSDKTTPEARELSSDGANLNIFNNLGNLMNPQQPIATKPRGQPFTMDDISSTLDSLSMNNNNSHRQHQQFFSDEPMSSPLAAEPFFGDNFFGVDGLQQRNGGLQQARSDLRSAPPGLYSSNWTNGNSSSNFSKIIPGLSTNVLFSNEPEPPLNSVLWNQNTSNNNINQQHNNTFSAQNTSDNFLDQGVNFDSSLMGVVGNGQGFWDASDMRSLLDTFGGAQSAPPTQSLNIPFNNNSQQQNMMVGQRNFSSDYSMDLNGFNAGPRNISPRVPTGRATSTPLYQVARQKQQHQQQNNWVQHQQQQGAFYQGETYVRPASVSPGLQNRPNKSRRPTDSHGYGYHRQQQQQQPESAAVEQVVARCCRAILAEAAQHSLKAVELANTLRARVGTDALARVRERWGGLLALLERHPHLFRVDRIPKNDKVTLIASQNEDSITAGPGEGVKQESPDDKADGGYHKNRPLHHQRPHSFHEALDTDPSLRNQQGQMTATRCLHVGNVPANMSEVHIMREFERFGQLEGLKLVCQRGGSRRFAFVTFRTVEQAITARHCLSKLHPWKSAISFAHKEFTMSPTSQGLSPQSAAEQHFFSPTPIENQYTSPTPGRALSTDSGARLMGLNFASTNHTSPTGYGLGSNVPASPDIGDALESVSGLSAAAAEFVSRASPGLGSPAGGWTPASNLPMAGITGDGNGDGGLVGSPSCPILKRLCDDTYVPTQPWPRDPLGDQLYCEAIAAQLQQFGGCTTVSKLRGFLRSRIAAVDNIKSVPLKALLAAYPALFRLENNFVSLLIDLSASNVGGVEYEQGTIPHQGSPVHE